MEVNRYLIAALYVMAGCAVTVPLKTQVESVSVECCRMFVSQTVRTAVMVSEDIKNNKNRYAWHAPHRYRPVWTELLGGGIGSECVRIESKKLCCISQKIRAPGC